MARLLWRLVARLLYGTDLMPSEETLDGLVEAIEEQGRRMGLTPCATMSVMEDQEAGR